MPTLIDAVSWCQQMHAHIIFQDTQNSRAKNSVVIAFRHGGSEFWVGGFSLTHAVRKAMVKIDPEKYRLNLT